MLRGERMRGGGAAVEIMERRHGGGYGRNVRGQCGGENYGEVVARVEAVRQLFEDELSEHARSPRRPRHSFFRCAAAFRMLRYPPAFGGGRVFLCRGALQKSENMIYLLHSRASCGGDMTDFGDLPRDAGDGARCASSPRGNARIRRSAFCGRVIFGGKI